MAKVTRRIDGYYWVKFDGEYVIAQKVETGWLIPGNETVINEERFEFIGTIEIEMLLG